MGDLSKASNSDTNLSRQKSLSVKDTCRRYKSLLHKWHADKHLATPNDPDKFNISEPKLLSCTVGTNTKAAPITPRTHSKPPAPADGDDLIISSPTLLCRTTSHISPTPSPCLSSSRKSSTDNRPSFDNDDELHISSPTLLARATSRICTGASPGSGKGNSPAAGTDVHGGCNFPEGSSGGSTPRRVASPVMSTPIFFSQSGVRRKPSAPVEKKLECSLEELCFGCVKKINITRDALASSGLLIQEEEILTIKVEPGWRKGTKIIFEGKGDERPGTLPADIIFQIEEKPHPLYERKGNDLELGVEVPLLDALTGCTMSVPLLGGDEMDLTIEDVIYPGYETTIPNQGMPRPKDEEKRGDLRLKFMVEFPSQLSKQQREEVARILGECSEWNF